MLQESTNAPMVLQRTVTGTISHLRPTHGTPAYEHKDSIPISSASASTRLSLLATARRELARKQLYSLFYRGPIIGVPDSIPVVPPESESAAMEAPQSNFQHNSPSTPFVDNTVIIAETDRLGGKPKSEERTRKTDKSLHFKPTTKTAATTAASSEDVGKTRQESDRKAAKRAEKERRKFEKKGRKSSKLGEKVTPTCDSTPSLSQGHEPEILVSDKKLGHKKRKRRKDELDDDTNGIPAEREKEKRRKKRHALDG